MLKRLKARPTRIAGLALLALMLIASLAVNFLLGRESIETYRLLSEAQLDPYGLKHPHFPRERPATIGDQPVVVLFGDSRARHWPAPPIGGFRFVNRGIDGQTTEQMRGRFIAHVAPLRPKVILIQAGINDLKAIPLLGARRDEIVADCKANLRHIVDQARATGATVIITTIFPPGPVSLARKMVWSPAIEQAVEDVNADVRALASGQVIVMDAWSLLQDHGHLRDGLGQDTLHLNARGYAVLNAELQRVLSLSR